MKRSSLFALTKPTETSAVPVGETRAAGLVCGVGRDVLLLCNCDVITSNLPSGILGHS